MKDNRKPRSLRAVAGLVLALSLLAPLTASAQQTTITAERVSEVAYNPLTLRLEIELTVKDGKASTARSVVGTLGQVVGNSGTSAFIVRLNEDADLGDTLAAFRANPNTALATPMAPATPDFKGLQNVHKIRLAVERYRAAFADYRTDRNEDVNAKVPGLGFLNAYLQWLEQRAYPFDSFDREVYNRAIETPAFTAANVNFLPNWRFLGPRDLNSPYRIYFGLRPVNGRANAIAYDPANPSILYAGGPIGGVFKSTDSGVNWTPLGDQWPLMGVSSIAVSPSNSNLVIVGTGDYMGFDVSGIGIMRSTDGGQTWTRIGASLFGSSPVSKVVFDPDNNNIVYATSGSGGRIYRSTDAGLNWSVAYNVTGDWDDLSIGGLANGVRPIYAIRSGTNATRIVRSTDQGASWTILPTAVTNDVNVTSIGTSNSTFGISVSRTDGNTVYILAGSDRRVYKTTNGGTSWTNSTNNFPNGSNNYNWSQSWYDWHIYTSTRQTANGPVDVVYVGLIDIVQSVDGAASWRSIGGGKVNGVWQAGYSNNAIVHVDQHSFAVHPTNPNEVMVGSDGGVYRLTFVDGDSATQTDDNITYVNLNANLAITQFYRISVHPTNPNIVLGGTQDNSSPYSNNNLNSWANPGAGDGSGNAISQANPNVIYHSSQFQNIYRTTNNFSSQSTITPSWTGQSTPFIGILRLTNDGRYLYANTNFLNRYDGNTGTWSLQLGGAALAPSGSTITAINLSPVNNNRIYTGASGRVDMSDNFGASFTRIDRVGQAGGLPDRTVKWIEPNPQNHNDVLVAVSGTGTAHVWRCADVTATAPVWVNVSGNLPDLPVNSVVRDPLKPLTHWFAATDIGVWATFDGGASWSDITQLKGLPRTQVDEIVLNNNSRTLTAGTFGRGMWQMTLPSYILLSVAANPNPVYAGDPSTGTVTLEAPAPAGGRTISLQSSDARVVVPASITVPAGATNATFPVTTAEATTGYSANIVGGIANDVRSTLFTVNPIDLRFLPSFSYRNGTTISGNVASLQAKDNNRLVFGQLDTKRADGGLVGLFTIGANNPQTMELVTDIRGNAAFNGVISVFNNTTNTYDVLLDTTIGTAEVTRVLNISVNSNYINANRQVLVQIICRPQTTGSRILWNTSLDRFYLKLRP